MDASIHVATGPEQDMSERSAEAFLEALRKRGARGLEKIGRAHV